MALYLREIENSVASCKSEFLNADKTAFVYKWTHIPTGKWYVGSRIAKGCHINDGYICSSREVKPLILKNTIDWKREIIDIGDSSHMYELEIFILQETDAKNNTMSFNRHNGNGKFTTLGRIEPENMKLDRMAKMKGIKKPKGFGQRIKDIRTGMKFNSQWRANIGLASKGRKQSEVAREKNRQAHLGKNNHFYGKTHTLETKIKCGVSNKGTKNKNWKGYWIAPTGEKFTTIKEAYCKYPLVAMNNLRIWCKNNKNGWSFEHCGESNV